jgi:hypothetical protein
MPPDPSPLVPSPLQLDILAALKGKALPAVALARWVHCGTHRLDRPRGLAELQATDPPLVVSGEKGYYRPDAPPP